MNLDKLNEELDNAKSIISLSNSFDKITSALNRSCDNLFKQLFNYRFSKFLYREYIILNKSKIEIANELNLPPSTVYYYIKKYRIKKTRELTNQKIVDTMRKTCNEKYNVNHPGELPEAHRKRIFNILNKTNGDYSKHFYDKLNRSEHTKQKMQISQRQRRYNEKAGEQDE